MIKPMVRYPFVPVSRGPQPKPRPEPRKERDIRLGLHFWVQLHGVEVAGFMECSGLVVETEVFEYAEGGLNTYTHKLPVRTKYSNITLKRGLDEGQDLYRWYMKTASGQIERNDVSIILYDTDQKVKYHWDLHEAYPVKWTGPDLKADAGAIAVETIEIAHSGLLPASGQQK